MSLTKEEREKIEAIKRQVAEQKRQEQAEWIEQARPQKQKMASAFQKKKTRQGVGRSARHFTLLDFFRFRYMATPEIVTGLFIVMLVAVFAAAVFVPGNVAWYVRAGMTALSIISLRLMMELSVVLFSINNHLAEISEKLDKKND